MYLIYFFNFFSFLEPSLFFLLFLIVSFPVLFYFTPFIFLIHYYRFMIFNYQNHLMEKIFYFLNLLIVRLNDMRILIFSNWEYEFINIQENIHLIIHFNLHLFSSKIYLDLKQDDCNRYFLHFEKMIFLEILLQFNLFPFYICFVLN